MKTSKGFAIISTFFIILIVFIGLSRIYNFTSYDIDDSAVVSLNKTDEKAEEVGFNFILDFIKIAPPDVDESAKGRVYNSLSNSLKEKVSFDNLSSDIANIIGVQDVPDNGASVQDLQINDNIAVLTVGLNYSGGYQERDIILTFEEDEWKILDVK